MFESYHIYIYITHNVLILAKFALPGQDTELKKAGFDAMPQNSLWPVVGTGVVLHGVRTFQGSYYRHSGECLTNGYVSYGVAV